LVQDEKLNFTPLKNSGYAAASHSLFNIPSSTPFSQLFLTQQNTISKKIQKIHNQGRRVPKTSSDHQKVIS